MAGSCHRRTSLPEGLTASSRRDPLLEASWEPQASRQRCPSSWAAGPLTALALILSVLTVVLFVTRPAHGDAPPTGTGKVIEGAPGTLHTWEWKVGVKTPLARASQPPSSGHWPLADLGSPAHHCSLHSHLRRHTPSWAHSRGMSAHRAGRASLSPQGGNSCCSLWRLVEGGWGRGHIQLPLRHTLGAGSGHSLPS